MTTKGVAQHESTSVEMTMALAATLASSLCAGDVVTLAGELGAGKTCFVRGLAHGLGLDAHLVSSPTFVLVHEYARPDSARLGLIHVDAYRLTGTEELESIGWRELLERRDAVIAVEWPERIAAEIPEKHMAVELAHGPQPNIRFMSVHRCRTVIRSDRSE